MTIGRIVPRDPTSKWYKHRERIEVECDVKLSKVCQGTWLTHHIDDVKARSEHICRNCIRARFASRAGKAAGAKAVATGQINQFVAAAASPESRLKALHTSRAKGRARFTSKPEDAFFELCCGWFGRDNVRRWCYITRDDGTKHSVDIHIVNIDTYVEVDGVYWHGLDRPYAELSEETRRKFDHDRRLDEYCRTNGIRLVRITDKEIEVLTSQELLDRVRGCTAQAL